MGDSCEYVLDPDNPATWGGDRTDEPDVTEDVLGRNGVWECPHETHLNDDVCIFHKAVDEKPNGKTRERLKEVITETAAADDSERVEVIGAKFGTLIARGLEIPSGVEWIDFTHCEFRGRFDVFSSAFSCNSNFKSAKFFSGVDFRRATFGGRADFSNAEFRDGFEFSGARFDGTASFESMECHGTADFRRASFAGRAWFESVVFHGLADFTKADFEKGYFEGARFVGDVDFTRATFRGNGIFNSAVFVGFCEFDQTTFDGQFTGFLDCEFKSKAQFYSVTFAETAFSDAVFEDTVSFTESTFPTRLSLTDVSFTGNALFVRTDLSGLVLTDLDLTGFDFRHADFTNADLSSSDLSHADLEQSDFSGATLFGTNLSGATLFSSRLAGAVVNTETVFDERGDHRCVYDPNSAYEYDPDPEADVDRLRKAMGCYHALEQLTRTNTLPDEQSVFFARRQDMRRAQLRRDESFPRSNYWFAELQNSIFRHGEGFSRVVAWSIGTIATFALIFPLGGWLRSETTGRITYDAIAASPVLLWKTFYHSTLLFLTGGGPLEPTGTAGEILTTIEALIAPILLALLVFVLGRRAAR